jgi:hypothetical protein
MENSTDVSQSDISTFRGEVSKEMGMEEKNLHLIDQHGRSARRLFPLILGLIIINIGLIFILPRYGIYWIVASFFVYMYYFIVLLLPTTRRVRTPAEKLEGKKKGPRVKRGQGIRAVATRGKKAVVVAFWNSFFIGTQSMAKGITLTMAISIGFAVLGLATGSLDLLSSTIIVIQAIAIMGYYYVIMRYRPYSKEFMRTVARVRRDRKTEARWLAYLKGLFIVLVLLTVLVVFLISAIFLPKRSLDVVLAHLDANFGLVIIGLVVIFISQFIIIRYVQGFDSARITSLFINGKIDFLKNDILAGLDQLENNRTSEDRSKKFIALQKRFRISRIYKVVLKDFFGFLPTYPIIVDFKSILEKDVAEALGDEIPLDIPG